MPKRLTLSAAIVTMAVMGAAGCSAADPDIAGPVTTAGPDEDAGPAPGTASGEVAAGLGTSGDGADPTAGPAAAPAPPGAEQPQLVASALGPTLEVWDSPSESPSPDHTLTASDEASGTIVLLVKQQLGPAWIEVYLPTAPAGTTGWVRQDQVALSQHTYRIVVARAAHTLTLYEGTEARLVAPVSIGAADAPAPAPGLFVKDLVETPSPDGAYGRYAYGLSGSTNRAEQFEAGRGVIAIHGLPDGTDAGADVPSGSLGVEASVLDELVTGIGVPLGTPVLLTD